MSPAQTRRIWFGPVLAVALVNGCAATPDGDESGSVGSVDAGADVRQADTAVDGTQLDAASDVTHADAGVDGTPLDAAADGTLADASGDATQSDASTDATHADASPDATPADASTDGTQADAHTDATLEGGADATVTDGGAEGGQDASGVVYSQFGDPTLFAAPAGGFVGAGFDGRYLYFVPSFDGTGADGVVARYDTQASFTTGSSWTTFDTTTVNPQAKGFAGASFDGRYLYLIASWNGPTVDGVVTRYDTQGSFTSLSSWTTFDTTTVDANAKGFVGAAFDGRYIYLVPNDDGQSNAGTLWDGVVARYDTYASFTAPGSWRTFDTRSVNALAEGFGGAAFDGRYLYLVPLDGGQVARYDTQGAFDAAASWATFYIGAGFFGAGFDGRYVYFVPEGGPVARYDTQASFTDASSWTSFSIPVGDTTWGGYANATFDGRYLYFVPYINNLDGSPYGTVARYDTLGTVTDVGSWSSFDTSFFWGPESFMGAAFDGRYVYLVPSDQLPGGATGVVVRFDARQPPAMPELCSNAAALHCFSGSFF
jgi:hypothetical protein